MSNHPLQVNINSNNEHLFLEIESQQDITVCVEFLERLFKKKYKEPVVELQEIQVSDIGSGPRKPTQR